MESVSVSCTKKVIKGEIFLSGSKSISNRVLLIKALCKETFPIHNLSDSDDTMTMEHLILSSGESYDAHHAGTTFRFMTAYLATRQGSQIITGSDRMKQRPIKALVDALNHLGADITYIENEGYPPLKINTPADVWKDEITLSASISSQYITALLLIAPTLTNGLTIHLEGEIVSRPYIEMTIGIMNYFGVVVGWDNQTITVKPRSYVPRAFHVEADWSAASYYYIIAGLSEDADILLHGLHKESLQGDAAVANIGTKFGLESSYHENTVRITKKADQEAINNFEYDFIKEPDIAQSISVLTAGLGVNGLFTGLQTLRIKETDRIAALQKELAKMQVYLTKMPEKFSKKTGIEYYLQEGKAAASAEEIPTIDTYNDHRMAMAFAPLALLFPIQINDPKVVSKSYPKYWKDLMTLGFEIV